MSSKSPLRLTLLACAVALTLPATCCATPPGRNGPILFTTDRGLYQVNADGRGLKKVTSRKVSELDAHPSGRGIVFASDYLYLMDLRTKRVRNLFARVSGTARFNGAYSPSWDPKGKRILFVGRYDGRLYTINGDGTGLRLLMAKNRIVGSTSTPRWSPKGDEIAFADVRDESSLHIYDLKTRRERVVYRYDPDSPLQAGTPQGFDWSPDGKRIALYLPYQDFIINADGTGLRKLSSDLPFSGLEYLSFSPDGKQIAGRIDSKIWTMSSESGARPELGGSTNLVTGSFPGNAFVAEWAPKPR